MKNKRGLTLMEIIVAIAILGILAVMLFPALTGQYSMMRKTRTMTEDLYSAQQQIEVMINDTKATIRGGEEPDGLSRTYYTIFSGKSYSRTVGGYASNINVHSGNDRITLNAVVADSQLSAFPVADIEYARIRLANSSGDLDFAYWDTASLRVNSEFATPEPEEINMYNITRWYVSRPGFNAPPVDDPLEIEVGSLYPRFPDDYSLITNYLLSDLTPIYRQYAGRHLIFSVTPVSNQFKMGKTVVSNSVFVNGLPYHNNLVLHLDASMIPIENATAVRTTEGTEIRHVARWLDISGYANDARQTTESLQPLLINEKIGDIEVNGWLYDTVTRVVRFSGGSALSIPHSSSLSLNNLTVIVVAKSEATAAPKTIVSKRNATGTGWAYGWTGSNQLGFTVQGPSVNVVNANSGEGLDNKWHIMTATASTTDGLVTLKMDSEDRVETARTATGISNTSPISIGFNGGDYSTVDVAEILVFNGTLAEADLYSVYTYLDNKYNPEPPSVSIYALKPFTQTVSIGESFTLPAMISAYMSNGTTRNVSVTWSPTNIVDTSVDGTFTFIATSTANPSKTTTGQVTVAGIDYLPDSTATVEQFGTYSLPATVTAVMSSGITHNTEVEWFDSTGINPVPSEVNTSTLGSYQFVGKSVLEPGKTMVMTVNIVPMSVTGVSLSHSSETLSIGQTLQLIETVEPPTAYNKTVSWSSSDETVIYVDPASGLVTALGSGNATVTVTTADGNYTATCTFTVRTPVTGITLNVGTKVIPRGGSYELIATIVPANASDPRVTWSSDYDRVTLEPDGNRATVLVANNAQNGRSVTITATAVDGGISTTCEIIVGRPVTGFSLSPSSMTITIGQNRSITANVSPNNATNKDVTWESLTPSVATVSSNGTVTGVSPGTAIIRATTVDGNFTADCTVTVDWRATGISDGSDPRRSFTLTFNTPMDRAVMDGQTFYASGNQITFTRSSDFATGTYSITAFASDGSSRNNISVRLNSSGFWWWVTYFWTLENP